MSGCPGQAGLRVVGALLALLAVLLAVRAGSWTLELAPNERLAATLGRALVGMQGAGGAFDPYPRDPAVPEVRRTGPHAMATYAMLRLGRTRAAAMVPGLPDAARRGLDVLLERQQPGGMFGGLPPGVGNPWPAVEATAEGVLALSEGARPEDRAALLASTAALARAAEYGFRNGWTRAVGALALHAAAGSGVLEEAGGDLARLLPLAEATDRVECGDHALAEAMARRVLGRGEALSARLLGLCLRDAPPRWEGPTSDPQAWWMGAWVAARSAGGGPYLSAVAAAVAEATAAPPQGRIPGGWFADEVTQTAVGLLAVLEVLEVGDGAGPLPRGDPGISHPGR